MFKSLHKKWKSHKKYGLQGQGQKYSSFGEMPTALVAFFAIAGFLVSGFYSFVLAKVVPEYLEVGEKLPLQNWGWKGWLLTAILAALAYVTWVFGSIALRCNGILRDRLFK